MTQWRKLAILGALAAGVGLTMVLTNPDRSQYGSYGSKALGFRLKREVCEEQPTILGGLIDCNTVVERMQPTFETLFIRNTKIRNLGLFSIFITDIKPSILSTFLPEDAFPSYHIETVGLFNFFITYELKTVSPPSN